jgi:hypothetical protein
MRTLLFILIMISTAVAYSQDYQATITWDHINQRVDGSQFDYETELQVYTVYDVDTNTVVWTGLQQQVTLPLPGGYAVTGTDTNGIESARSETIRPNTSAPGAPVVTGYTINISVGMGG